MTKCILFAVLSLLFLVARASAHLFQLVEVSEAVEHANAWIKDHPDRAEGYFFLGGVDCSAWAYGVSGDGSKIEVDSLGDKDRPPRFVPWNSVMFQRINEPVGVSDFESHLQQPKQKEQARKRPAQVPPITADSLKRLAGSIDAYRKAIELDPKAPRYHLALAWSLELASVAKLDPLLVAGASTTQPTKSEDRESDWRSLAIEQYRKAYQLSVDADLKAEKYDAEADRTVSVKAGERLVYLLPKAGDSNADEVRQIEKSIELIVAMPTVGHNY